MGRVPDLQRNLAGLTAYGVQIWTIWQNIAQIHELYKPEGSAQFFSAADVVMCFGMGAVLLFINFLAVRQAVTPAPLLGRMTSIMRWLILIPAGPGALLGGWLGEHAGLRVALGFGGAGALLLGVWVWAASPLRHITRLPKLETTENPVHKGVQP